MKTKNWLKKHEKAVAAGLCAGLLCLAGSAGAGLYEVQALTFAKADGTTSAADTCNEAVSGLSEDTEYSENTYHAAVAQSTEAAVEKEDAEVNGAGAVEHTAELSGDVAYNGPQVLLEGLGLLWSEKGFWLYEEKPVGAVWVEDGSLTTWGSAKDKDSVFLYIEKDAGKGEVTFRLRELGFDEFAALYEEKNPGSSITRE